jgi:predicted phosphodiesterase
MSSKRRFIVISDIHFNDGNAGRITDELNKCFFPYVKKNKEGLSALIIAGDLFDTKIGFNSIAAFLVINFIMRLVEILGDIPLIIIKGTRTHDFNQLETFNFINDVTIVNTYEGFDIDDAKVLFLPEEYVSNADKYYNFDDMAEKFDLIVMHGMIDFAAYTSNTMESEKEVPSAVTFKSDRLNNLATVTIAGHVHISFLLW